MPIKVNGLTTGSVTLAAPDTGSDVTVSLPGVSGELLPLAGGKILQVVRATDTTNRSTSSTSYVDASISVSITPTKSTSAVLIIWTSWAGASGTPAYLRITDNSNNALSGAEEAEQNSNTSSIRNLIGYSTPATTSSVTYKGRFRVFGTGTVTIFNASQTGQMYAIEVSA